jgi:hypothetical protein
MTDYGTFPTPNPLAENGARLVQRSKVKAVDEASNDSSPRAPRLQCYDTRDSSIGSGEVA